MKHKSCGEWHNGSRRLSYSAWHSDADERHERGETQIQCPSCSLWIWESFYKEKPKPMLVDKKTKQVISGDDMNKIQLT